mmetsp:Transcript_1843/g.2617  ORF Transcript_1843/g.2617 Transcript_1843/m.2617 type:complete len:86 (+) Transcript_1843:128-385(+)
MGITKEFQISMVHRDEFTDMRAEFGSLFKSMNEMRVFREKIEQQATDDHYLLLKQETSFQETDSQLEKLSVEFKKAQTNLAAKLD